MTSHSFEIKESTERFSNSLVAVASKRSVSAFQVASQFVSCSLKTERRQMTIDDKDRIKTICVIFSSLFIPADRHAETYEEDLRDCGKTVANYFRFGLEDFGFQREEREPYMELEGWRCYAYHNQTLFDMVVCSMQVGKYPECWAIAPGFGERDDPVDQLWPILDALRRVIEREPRIEKCEWIGDDDFLPFTDGYGKFSGDE